MERGIAEHETHRAVGDTLQPGRLLDGDPVGESVDRGRGPRRADGGPGLVDREHLSVGPRPCRRDGEHTGAAAQVDDGPRAGRQPVDEADQEATAEIDRAAGERPAVRAHGQAQIIVPTRGRLGARRVSNRLARPQHPTLLPTEAGADPAEMPGQDVVHAPRQMLDPPAGENADGRCSLARNGLGQFIEGGQALGQPEQHRSAPRNVSGPRARLTPPRPSWSAARSPPVRRSASHGSARPFRRVPGGQPVDSAPVTSSTATAYPSPSQPEASSSCSRMRSTASSLGSPASADCTAGQLSVDKNSVDFPLIVGFWKNGRQRRKCDLSTLDRKGKR